MHRPGSGANRATCCPMVGARTGDCPEVCVHSPTAMLLSGLSACRERQMCRRRSRCCLLASDGRRCRDSQRDVEEEEKEEDGKLILMLSKWLRVDVFEIPLRKKKRLDHCSRKNSSAGRRCWCAGPQRRPARQIVASVPWSGVFVWTCGWRRDRGARVALQLSRHPL